MLYAANVVMVPQNQKTEVPSAIVKKLISIQRQAAVLISGAMSMTTTDILNIHAALLSMPLKIQQHRQQAATRLETLPGIHPLAKSVKEVRRDAS